MGLYSSYLHPVQTQIAHQCFNRVYTLPPLLSRIDHPNIVHEHARKSLQDISNRNSSSTPTPFFKFFKTANLKFSSFHPEKNYFPSPREEILLTKRYPFPSRVARNRHGTKTSLSSSRISPLSPIDCVRLRAIVPLYPLASSPRFRPRLPTRFSRLRSSSRTMAGGRGTALYLILKIYARINRKPGNCRFQTPREGNLEIRGGHTHTCRPTQRKIARKREKNKNNG